VSKSVGRRQATGTAARISCETLSLWEQAVRVPVSQARSRLTPEPRR
jgi:hypothetical protein